MLLGSFAFVLCVVSPQEKPVTQRPDDWSLVEGQKSLSQIVPATHGLWHTCTTTHEHTHTQMSQLSKCESLFRGSLFLTGRGGGPEGLWEYRDKDTPLATFLHLALPSAAQLCWHLRSP